MHLLLGVQAMYLHKPIANLFVRKLEVSYPIAYHPFY
jgi:hypothetical protein